MRTPRDPQGIDRAKRLRGDMSPPERALWEILRGQRLAGWKFSRQVSVGPFTIDFAARRGRLAIDLDGGTHAGRKEHDAHRTSYLEKAGWTVIRFTNVDIGSSPEAVAMTILDALGRPARQRAEA